MRDSADIARELYNAMPVLPDMDGGAEEPELAAIMMIAAAIDAARREAFEEAAKACLRPMCEIHEGMTLNWGVCYRCDAILFSGDCADRIRALAKERGT
jgi:hypothetical protein